MFLVRVWGTEYRLRPLWPANPANWDLQTPGSAMAIHGHIDFEQEKSQFLFRARSLLRDL